MASVNVTINGVICDLYGRTITGPVKVVGEMMYSDRQVGGGPIYPQPPDEKPPERPPVGIWPGPGDPDFPGGGKPPIDIPPPSIWPGPGDPDYPAGPHPEHPIVIPRPPGGGETPPIPPGTLITWKAVWVPPAVTGGDGSWMILGTPNVPHPSPS